MTRVGPGKVVVAAAMQGVKGIFSKSKQESPRTPEAMVDQLEIIIEDSRNEINERRSEVARVVQELMTERNARFDQDSSAEDESEVNTAEGSQGGSSS